MNYNVSDPPHTCHNCTGHRNWIHVLWEYPDIKRYLQVPPLTKLNTLLSPALLTQVVTLQDQLGLVADIQSALELGHNSESILN